MVDGHKVMAFKLTVIDNNPMRAVMKCDPAVVPLASQPSVLRTLNLRVLIQLR